MPCPPALGADPLTSPVPGPAPASFPLFLSSRGRELTVRCRCLPGRASPPDTLPCPAVPRCRGVPHGLRRDGRATGQPTRLAGAVALYPARACHCPPPSVHKRCFPARSQSPQHPRECGEVQTCLSTWQPACPSLPWPSGPSAPFYRPNLHSSNSFGRRGTRITGGAKVVRVLQMCPRQEGHTGRKVIITPQPPRARDSGGQR
jgi:hypothetical protein